MCATAQIDMHLRGLCVKDFKIGMALGRNLEDTWVAIDDSLEHRGLLPVA